MDYREQAPPKIHSWEDLRVAFESDMDRRILLGEMAESTRDRYKQTIKAFNTFVIESATCELSAINRAFLEMFKVWRLTKIREKKFARGGRGLSLDVAILHGVFSFAIEAEMVEKNPVRMEGRPGDHPEFGAQPFTGEQLASLRIGAKDDLLAFLLLLWTGLRGSDAVKLTWGEVNLHAREIVRVTQKRRKRVVIPISQELLFRLEVECNRQSPGPSDRVLVNPATGKSMTRPRLYQRMKALGVRSGVADVHPHRFRDTFAVDMLVRGIGMFEVAQMLGDDVATVEKYYATFIPELRNRVRNLMNNGEGIAKLDCTSSARSNLGSLRTH